MTVLPFPFGRHLEPNHDPRSLRYPAAAATVVTKSWSRGGVVLDQGQLGSCTGNAMAHAINTKPVHKPYARYLTEPDAVALYSRATQLDPFRGTYPPTDTGSDGMSACKAAKEAGKITGYLHGFGLDHSLQALMSGPVMFGTPWRQDMYYPDSQGFVRPTGPVVGGHEYVGLGVNVQYRYVTCLNSWSNLWGLRGYFRIGFDDLAALLDDGGDCTQPVRAA